MNSLKEQFLVDYSADSTKHLIIAVQLPTGAIEIIHNTECLNDKAKYYLNAYDEDFRLKANPEVRIINYMIV